MNFLTSLFKPEHERILAKIRPIVTLVNNFEESIQKLTDEELKSKTTEFKDRLSRGEDFDKLMPEAIAVVREAAKRTLNMRHFDVQVIGGIVLFKGMIAEMRTGEGKTLVATIPVYLAALQGQGAHVVTVNDYLAKRDGEQMGQVYNALGLSVGIINSNQVSYMYDPSAKQLDNEADTAGYYKVYEEFLKPCTRKEAYACDITYGTNHEYGFDYLRDNTVIRIEDKVQRVHAFALVDEADSILIDEARVPLILSGQADDAAELYKVASRIASILSPEDDFKLDEKLKAIQVTKQGIAKIEKELGLDNLYTAENMKYVHHVETAIKARHLYKNDIDYVVRNGEVMIVDPFTGRLQEGRRWSDGLHQSIEAKEGVEIQSESRTLASITYQNYFKLYKKLAGMTGTAMTSKEEFARVYNLDVVPIPTHRPIARVDLSDLIFIDIKAKYNAIVEHIKEIHKTGQPILIGTVAIEKNELLSQYLTRAGVRHTVLNAKNHEAEGLVIAEAGKRGSVTIATNMAGRGVDIKLGGPQATQEEADEIRALGGLFVLGTERHEARRIDNQLRGRTGRQGDPGKTQFYVSLDDDLMRIFGGDKVKELAKSLGVADSTEPVSLGFLSSRLEDAQDRVEGFHFDSRKHILEYDDVASYHRTLIYKRRDGILSRDEAILNEIVEETKSRYPDAGEAIDAKRSELDETQYKDIIGRVALFALDRLWSEHLDLLEQSKQSAGLRSYGQREPVVEYKKESIRLFKELENAWYGQIAEILGNLDTKAIKEQQPTVTTARIS
ncbi:MAG TPA: preprotein translocase subunit SecA [Candidatus Paceibacterota bacterium]